jgi:MFS family permease
MRERAQMLTVASAALLLSVLVWFNYSAVLPLIVEDWELSGLRAGIIFGAFQAGYLLAIVPLGVAADRYSPRWVIALGASVTGLASLAFALLARGFATGTGFRFLAGTGMAGVYVPGMRFVTDWYPEADRGRAMGFYVGTFSLSSGLSFLVSSAVAAAVDWRSAIVATSVGALAVGPLVLGLGRDSPTAERNGAIDRNLSVLRNRSYLAAVGVYSWHNWELFGVRNWIVAFLLSTPAIATSASPATTAGTLAGVMIMLGGVGNVVGGWLSDRWGRLRTIGLALGVSGAISAVLGGMGAVPRPAFVAVVLVYGIFLTMDSAPTSTAITELVADERVGTALSFQSLVGFATTVVSPVVFGAALDEAGYPVAFRTLAAGAALALVCLAALRRAK